MARQIRSDCTIGSLEKRLGFKDGGVFRHKNGRDIRSDMKLKTLRKKYLKQATRERILNG